MTDNPPADDPHGAQRPGRRLSFGSSKTGRPTTGGSTIRTRGWRPSLTTRLIAAFVTIAVVAVLVLAGLMMWRTKHSVGELAAERQQSTADAIAETLAIDYGQSGGWAEVDAHPALMLAVQAGATMRAYGSDGAELELRNSMGSMPDMDSRATGPTRTAPIVSDGKTVGSVQVTFVSNELAEAETHVGDALRGTIVSGTILAATLAMVLGSAMAQRLIASLRRTTNAARMLGQGATSARAGHHDAPGELGELNRAFDEMAGRLEAHDVARRHVSADIAHELRTPLTLLQGECEAVIDGLVEPSTERFVQMHDDVLRVRRLVDDLAALADADAALAGPSIATEPVDISTIASLAADALRPLIDAHRHRLDLQLAPVEVIGDRARLRQIITNLLTNAIKFTADGGRIGVRTAQVGADEPVAIIEVWDSGPGISDEDQPHVFDRFYRGASHRSVTGSGIGLAVVHSLVVAHHGEVSIATSALGGALIRVTLPLA